MAGAGKCRTGKEMQGCPKAKEQLEWEWREGTKRTPGDPSATSTWPELGEPGAPEGGVTAGAGITAQLRGQGRAEGQGMRSWDECGAWREGPWAV